MQKRSPTSLPIGNAVFQPQFPIEVEKALALGCTIAECKDATVRTKSFHELGSWHTTIVLGLTIAEDVICLANS